MFKSFLSFLLIGVFVLEPALITGTAFASQNITTAYRSYCNDYKNPSSPIYRNKNKVPNIPISTYLENFSGTVNEKELFLKTIEEDRLCMATEDARAVLEKTTDANKRAELLAQILKQEQDLNKLRDDILALNEKIIRENEILTGFYKHAIIGFEKSRETLIKKRDEVRQVNEDFLAEELEKREELNFDELLAQAEILHALSLEDQKRALDAIGDEVKSEITEISKIVAQLIKDFDAHIDANLSPSLETEKEAVLAEIEKEFTVPELKQKALESAEEIFDDRMERYKEQKESLKKASLAPYQVLIEYFEKMLNMDFSSLTAQDVSVVRNFVASTALLLQNTGGEPVKNIEIQINELLVDLNPLVHNLISMMYQPDFVLYSFLKNDSSALNTLVQNLRNRNYLAVEEFIEGQSQEFQNGLSQAIAEQKQVIEAEYRKRYQEINKLTDGDIALLSAQNKEFLIHMNTELQKMEVYVISAEEEKMIQKLPYSDTTKELLRKIALEYGGYLDFLIWRFAQYPQEEQEEKIQLFSHLALDISFEFFLFIKEKARFLHKTTEQQIVFLFLKVLFEYFEQETGKMSARNYYKTIYERYNLEDTSINESYKNEFNEFKNNREKYFGYSSNILMRSWQKIKEHLNISSQKEESLSTSLRLPDHLTRELMRRAKRQYRGLLEESFSKFTSRFTQDSRASVSENNGLVFEDSETKMYSFPDEKLFVLEEKIQKEWQTTEIYWMNTQDKVEVSLDFTNKGIVAFFQYDSQGRITEILEAHGASLWNQETQKFEYPKFWNQKNAEGEYIIVKQEKREYVLTKGQYEKKVSFSSPLLSTDPKKPYQIRETISLYDEIFSSSFSKLTKNNLRTEFVNKMKQLYPVQNNTQNQEELKRLPARFITKILQKNGLYTTETEYVVYYDNLLNQDLFTDSQHKDFLIFSHSDIDVIQNKYGKDFNIIGVLDIENDLSLYDYIGPNGKLLGFSSFTVTRELSASNTGVSERKKAFGGIIQTTRPYSCDDVYYLDCNSSAVIYNKSLKKAVDSYNSFFLRIMKLDLVAPNFINLWLKFETAVSPQSGEGLPWFLGGIKQNYDRKNALVSYITQWDIQAKRYIPQKVSNDCITELIGDLKNTYRSQIVSRMLFSQNKGEIISQYIKAMEAQVKENDNENGNGNYLCNLYGMPLGEGSVFELHDKPYPAKNKKILSQRASYIFSRSLLYYESSKDLPVLKKETRQNFYSSLLQNTHNFILFDTLNSKVSHLFKDTIDSPLYIDEKIGLPYFKTSSNTKGYIDLYNNKVFEVNSQYFSLKTSNINAKSWVNTANSHQKYVLSFLGNPVSEKNIDFNKDYMSIEGYYNKFQHGDMVYYGKKKSSWFPIFFPAYAMVLHDLPWNEENDFNTLREKMVSETGFGYPFTNPYTEEFAGKKGTVQEFLDGTKFFLSHEDQKILRFSTPTNAVELCKQSNSLIFVPDALYFIQGASDGIVSGFKNVILITALAYSGVLPGVVILYSLGNTISYFKNKDTEMEVILNQKAHNQKFQCPAQQYYLLGKKTGSLFVSAQFSSGDTIKNLTEKAKNINKDNLTSSVMKFFGEEVYKDFENKTVEELVRVYDKNIEKPLREHIFKEDVEDIEKALAKAFYEK